MKDITTKQDVALIVEHFYNALLKDATMRPFFTEIMPLELKKHLPIITNFWEKTLLGTGNYMGNPMVKHLELNELRLLEKQHFVLWLGYWELTVNNLFKGKKTTEIVQRARQIALVMQYKLGLL